MITQWQLSNSTCSESDFQVPAKFKFDLKLQRKPTIIITVTVTVTVASSSGPTDPAGGHSGGRGWQCEPRPSGLQAESESESLEAGRTA